MMMTLQSLLGTCLILSGFLNSALLTVRGQHLGLPGELATGQRDETNQFAYQTDNENPESSNNRFDLHASDQADANGSVQIDTTEAFDWFSLQATLLSTKGTLAFWRQLVPTTDSQTADSMGFGTHHDQIKWTNLVPTDNRRKLQQQLGQKLRSNRDQDQASTVNQDQQASKCPHDGLLLTANLRPTGYNGDKMLQNSLSRASIAHILVVENTNIELNFVVGAQRVAYTSKHKQSSPIRTLSSKVTIDWLKVSPAFQQTQSINVQARNPHQGTRIGSRPLARSSSSVAVPSHLSSPPIPSSSSSSSSTAHSGNGANDSRFSQLIMSREPNNPNDQLAQSTHSRENHTGLQESSHNQQPSSSGLGDEWLEFQSFMLSPYVNEPLINRLAVSSSNQIPGAIMEAKQIKLSAVKRSETLNLLDTFVGPASDSSSVDWPQLVNLFTRDPKQVSSQPSECDPTIESQVLVIRLQVSQLSLTDSGHYQMRVCLPANSLSPTISCQTVAFYLTVASDIPKLESWPESQILEPGDRMSIKCQATGFTLPQISWFIDGRLLSEQAQLMQAGQHDLSSNFARSLIGSHFRTGDYVSQDNHVHSFVNSSHIDPNDGGAYKCQANNGLHSVEHVARIDVRGPPVIGRLLPNHSALIGAELEFQCPFSGHPISTVEWYFRPASSDSGRSPPKSTDLLDSDAFYTLSQASRPRARREQSKELRTPTSQQRILPDTFVPPFDSSASLQDQYQDSDNDEWLSQASSIATQGPNSDDDPPESWPDYPPSDLIPAMAPWSNLLSDTSEDYDSTSTDYKTPFGSYDEAESTGKTVEEKIRKERDLGVATSNGDQWTQFPQSRRHQIHSNGTLLIQSVTRADQGFYKCRVVGVSSNTNDLIDRSLISSSNEFLLTVLVPPVISPFSSAESLREGMRNFLTCSVIEGDSPIQLAWFKDGRPIEEYMALADSLEGSSRTGSTSGDSLDHSTNSQRIRVETSNEFTSTLYFSQVDFKDNGNYTCMATNKAASVNYTAKMLVNVPPKWIKAPKDIECIAGQNVIIDCQAQAYPNPRIWWELGVYSGSKGSSNDQASKVAVSQTSSGVSSVSNQARNSAIQQQQSSINLAGQWHQHPPNSYRTIISNSRTHTLENASLVIRDVSRQDQGYYLCQAANNFGSLSALIRLTVNVGASFVQKYSIKHVRLNEKVELDCDPIGQSPVDVVWFWRQGSSLGHQNQQQLQAITSSNGDQQQLISNLTGLNHHSYGGNNMANQSSRQQQPLRHSLGPLETSVDRRLFSGSIRTDISPGQQQQLSQTGASKWHTGSPKQQTLVELDSSMAFELVKRGGSDSQSELVRMNIKQAKRIHSTDFVCQASNRYGSDEKLIRLLVQEPPDPVSEISILQVDSRSVSLAWLAPFNGNSPIASYTLEWRPLSSQHQSSDSTVSKNSQTKWSHLTTQQNSATISSLQPLMSYEVRVRAHNQFGSSDQTTNQPTGLHTLSHILVTTNEEAPNAPPADIRALPTSSSSIQISWLPPTPSTNEPVSLGEDPSKQVTADPYNEPVKPGRHFTIKGYYLGYKVVNSNDSYLFKTVSLVNDANSHPSQDPSSASLLAAPDSLYPSDQKAYSTKTGNQTTSNDSRRLKVVIGDLKRGTKYTIIAQAFNSAGPGPQSDPLEAKTLLSDPPLAPQLRITQSTYSSIELQWSFFHSESNFDTSSESGSSEPAAIKSRLMRPLALTGASSATDSLTKNSEDLPSIDGYRLYYRLNDGTWLERHLTPDTHRLVANGLSQQRNEWSIVDISQVSVSRRNETNNWHSQLEHKASIRFTLDQLNCGSSYQIYLIAYNSIGSGAPSQIVRAKTRGSTPIAPRRLKEFISMNSTYAILNLDAWLDSGCSISNFEVRYVHLPGGRSDLSQISSSSNDRNWLLYSNHISPEQREVELRDLQPESWYSVLIGAESIAGKTEAQYTFITLDKFGNIPAAAMEASAETSDSFPMLFHGSSASIRALLNSLSSLKTFSILFVGCILVIFVTCLLLTIRYRTNGNLSGKDNASVDSQITTTGAMSSSHYTLGCSLMEHSTYDGYPDQKHSIDSSGRSSYQLRAPFKANKCNNQLNKMQNSGKLSLNQDGIETSIEGVCDEVDLTADIGGLAGQNAPFESIRTPVPNCPIHPNQFNGGQEDLYRDLQNKFSTLTREANELDHGRFRTLPHGRPVSTFTPPNGTRPFASVCQDQQQQFSEQQQQIYSKLRLIYNPNNNYNICPSNDQQKQVNQIDNPGIYNNQDAIGLAIFAQQQQTNQKIKRDTLYNTLHGNPNELDDIILSPVNQTTNATTQDQLASFLIDYQPQQQQQHLLNQLMSNESQQLMNAAAAAYGLVGPPSSGSVATGSTVSTSQSQSTEAHQQATPSSSSILSNVTSSVNSSSLSDQPINGLSGNGPSKQAQTAAGIKGFQAHRGANCNTNLDSSNCNGSSHANCTNQSVQQATAGNNEQSDYALPFPPKWV